MSSSEGPLCCSCAGAPARLLLVLLGSCFPCSCVCGTSGIDFGVRRGRVLLCGFRWPPAVLSSRLSPGALRGRSGSPVCTSADCSLLGFLAPAYLRHGSVPLLRALLPLCAPCCPFPCIQQPIQPSSSYSWPLLSIPCWVGMWAPVTFREAP